tara:strand:+ start:184 stop:627 length:444 start_codon:yes stop_codon:yes gene_type:complete
MAKFIKFKISNATTLAAGGDYARDVLVGVDDIENAADAVSGGGAYTVILTLKGIVGLDNEAAAATIGGRIVTLTVSTSPIAAANPTAITVSQNMPSQAVIRALTANPGGVSSTCQLGVDGNGVVAAQGGTAAQMYWSSAVFSSDNTL